MADASGSKWNHGNLIIIKNYVINVCFRGEKKAFLATAMRRLPPVCSGSLEQTGELGVQNVGYLSSPGRRVLHRRWI